MFLGVSVGAGESLFVASGRFRKALGFGGGDLRSGGGLSPLVRGGAGIRVLVLAGNQSGCMRW